MSLRTSLESTIPEETMRVARAAFPKGNVFMQRRDALGPLYTNAQFAPLFSYTGQPAEDPARLALVLVMQFTEGLSDRQAADAVRGRIDWKYVLALELTDPGFDASILSEFRTRLIHGEADSLLLETVLTLLQERNLLKPTVSPLLTPIASRNILLLQSPPDITPYRPAKVRRQKDEHPVGTATRGITERLSRLSRPLPSDGGSSRRVRRALPTGA